MRSAVRTGSRCLFQAKLWCVAGPGQHASPPAPLAACQVSVGKGRCAQVHPDLSYKHRDALSHTQTERPAAYAPSESAVNAGCILESSRGLKNTDFPGPAPALDGVGLGQSLGAGMLKQSPRSDPGQLVSWVAGSTDREVDGRNSVITTETRSCQRGIPCACHTPPAATRGHFPETLASVIHHRLTPQ